MDHLRPAIVSDIDREWSMAQMPDWCQRGEAADEEDEVIDDGGWLENAPSKKIYEKPSWALFVSEEIERFERHYAVVLRPAAEWSSIWRLGWWPKVSAQKRFPKSAPKVFYPFFRRGTPEFVAALKVATMGEKTMWERFGIAQFKPDDPRLSKISKRTTGDAA